MMLDEMGSLVEAVADRRSKRTSLMHDVRKFAPLLENEKKCTLRIELV